MRGSGVIAALALAAGPPKTELWECGDYIRGCRASSLDCVILTANLDAGTGEVKFGGIREDTSFRVDGLDRRWNWCLESDGTYDCAFVVSVSGSGAYPEYLKQGVAKQGRRCYKMLNSITNISNSEVSP